MIRFQNPNHTKPILSKSQKLWLGCCILFVLLYSGYQTKPLSQNFNPQETHLITDNLSLERPNIKLFFSDARTLLYHEGETVFRPLFTLGLALDQQFEHPLIFRFHVWVVFLLLCGVLFLFSLQSTVHYKYWLIALLLLTLLPSTSATLGNVLHRGELSATLFLLTGFWLLSRQRLWSAILALISFVMACFTHELAWVFPLLLGFYVWRKSYDEIFGILWCVSIGLFSFWVSPSRDPFAPTGFMMSIGLFFMLPPLLKKIHLSFKFSNSFDLKRTFGILLLTLYVAFQNQVDLNNSYSKERSILEQYRIGTVLLSENQWDKAQTHFEALHLKAPYHRPTFLRLVETSHALEDWDTINDIFSEALEKGYAFELAQRYQEIVVYKTPRVTVLEETFAAKPTKRTALTLAQEYFRRGEYAQSAHFARWILKTEPNSEKALKQLGEAYAKLGNTHDAKRAFQKAGDMTTNAHAALAAME